METITDIAEIFRTEDNAWVLEQYEDACVLIEELPQSEFLLNTKAAAAMVLMERAYNIVSSVYSREV